MIVYPESWYKYYGALAYPNSKEPATIEEIIDRLIVVLKLFNVKHLAYSGGVDSTILLCLLTKIYGPISTYTISSRDDHKDMEFARIGSALYKSKHTEFVVVPTTAPTDKFTGDNAVRQLFENVSLITDSLICGDGVDEFMCGYHKHKDVQFETYRYFLDDLTPGHLVPLNANSKYVKVYVPYLDSKLIDMYRSIPLEQKVDSENRKKITSAIAEHLGLPDEIIYRHKYGFVDAFREYDKST